MVFRPWFIVVNQGLLFLISCHPNNKMMIKGAIVSPLTQANHGHSLHHNGVFSADGQWIVFDGRNDDTKIGETATIGIVNTQTGEERLVYKTANQTVYGPGVGAASFNPLSDEVIFIHGLKGANQEKPYAITRRIGMLVDVHNTSKVREADSRDVLEPYTLGSLRGGTHSHCWSPEGDMLSFTYNDAFVEPDLRMVGVMVPYSNPIIVSEHAGNNNGSYYAAIVSDVVANPKAGSNEINKAFDECWLTPLESAAKDHYSIAFQGNTLNKEGDVLTEIFVVGIDPEKIKADQTSIGFKGQRPQVPKGIQQRRLSFSQKGLSDLRHWLRASADGQFIYALAKDQKQNNQIVQCAVTDGELNYITAYDFSISSPININKQGDKLTFIAQNNVFVLDINQSVTNQLTHFKHDDAPLIGAPVFSPVDNKIAFNQYRTINSQQTVQINIVEW